MADEQDVMIPQGPYPIRRQSRGLHLVEEIPEFQPGQRVKVREESREGSAPPIQWLGKEGTIQYGTARQTEEGPPTFYVVEFDTSPHSDNVFAISSDWLEPR